MELPFDEFTIHKARSIFHERWKEAKESHLPLIGTIYGRFELMNKCAFIAFGDRYASEWLLTIGETLLTLNGYMTGALIPARTKDAYSSLLGLDRDWLRYGGVPKAV